MKEYDAILNTVDAKKDALDRIRQLESENATLHATYEEFVRSGESEQVKRLRSALTAAVELIRMWHNLSFSGNGPIAELAWKGYQQGPEMREIREALT